MPSVTLEEIRLIVHVGLMLILGLLGGELVARIRVPRVTGYLLAGLLISPSVGRLIDVGELRNFDLIAQLALGVIMFNIGGEFKGTHVRRFGGKLLTVAAFQMVLTWAVVGLFVWLLSRDAVLAIIVGFIAMETAPATTLVVVREYEAEGPLTSNLIAIVGINNFILLVLFPFLFVILMSDGVGLGTPFLEVGKSLLLGIAVGVGLSFLEERELPAKQQVLLGLGAITLVVGLAYAWEGSGPLSALVMGMAKVNSSARGPVLFQNVDSAAYPLYVLFFVIAGANLHLETLLQVGALGFVYIVGRSLAKIVGTAWGAYATSLSKDLRVYMGPAMLSHAGVAIGMTMAVAQLAPPAAGIAQAVVLGSIVLFEFIGPVTTRFSLVRCGEVKMVSLLPHMPGRSSRDILESVLGQIGKSLGLSVGKTRARGPIAVKHIMRSNVETVPEHTRLDELLKIISRARYDLLPVVDKEGRYIGNISFHRIRDVIFDQAVADLVIARDLLDIEPAYVTPDETLDSALQKFSSLRGEVGNLPVVAEGESPQVVGMIRQRDAVDAFWRLRNRENELNS